MPMKKNIIIAIVLVFLLFVGLVFLDKNRKKQVSEPPASLITPAPQQISFRSVIPGKTTREQIIKLLGNPVDTKQNPQETTLYYPSSGPERNTAIILNNYQVVILIIEPVYIQIEYDAFARNFQNSELVLYGPFAPLGFNLYVNTQEGAAYLANPIRKIIYERWYFPLTSAAEFLPLYAASRGYGITPPPKEQE